MSDEQGQVAVKIYGDASAVNAALDSVIAKVEKFAQDTGAALKEWGVGADKSMSEAALASAKYTRALEQVEAKTTASLNRLNAARAKAAQMGQAIQQRFDRAQISQEETKTRTLASIAERGTQQRSKIASEGAAAMQRIKLAADRALLVGQEQTNAKVLRLEANLARAQGELTRAAAKTREAVMAETNAKVLDDKLREDAQVLKAEAKFQDERASIIREASAEIADIEAQANGQRTRAMEIESDALSAAESEYQAKRLRTEQEAAAEALRIRQESALEAAKVSGAGGAEVLAAEGSALDKALSMQKIAADKAVDLTQKAQAKATEITEASESRRLRLLETAEDKAAKILATGQAKSQAMMAKDVDKGIAVLEAAKARRSAILQAAGDKDAQIEAETQARILKLKSKAAADGAAIQLKAADESEALVTSAGEVLEAEQQAHVLKMGNILRAGEAAAGQIEAAAIRTLEEQELAHGVKKAAIQAEAEAKVQGAAGKSGEVLVALENEKNATVLAAETAHQDAMTALVSEGVKRREMLEAQGAKVAEAESAGAGSLMSGKGHGSYDLRHAGFGLMVTAGLMAAPIIEAGKQYTEFDAQLHKILAQAGERLLTFNQLQQRTLALSRQLGVAPATVAATLFNDESAGFHGDAAFKMSTSSLRLAVAGRSKPEAAANVLTKLLQAYSLPPSKAPEVSDKLIKAVGLSHTDLAHFGPAVSNGAQDAANAHIDLDSYLAALSTVTRVAPNANISATGLRNFTSHMVRPTPAMNKAFNAMGMGQYADGNAPAEFEKPGGFDRFVDLAKAKTQGNSAAAAAMFPDLRTERGAFPLLKGDAQGRGFKEVHAEQKGSAGATDKAFAEQDKSFERKIERFHATSSAFMMDFLSVAKGMAEPIIGKLVDLGNKLIDGWNKLPDGGKKAIVVITLLTTGLLALAGIIATVAFFVEPVIAVFTGLGTALFGTAATVTATGEAIAAVPGILAALTGPIGWVIAGVTALGIAWATNLGGIRDKTRGIMQAVEHGFKEALDFVVGYVRAGLAEASAFWNEHHKEIEIICAMIYESVRANLAALYAIFLHVWPLIAGVVKSAWAAIVLVFRAVKTVLEAIVITLLDALSGHWSRWWSDMKKLAADMGPDLEAAFENIFRSLGEGIIASFSGTIGQIKAMWQEAVHEIAHGTFNLGDIISAGNQGALGAMGATHKEYGPVGANGLPTGSKSGGNGDPYGDPGAPAASHQPGGVPSWETASAAESARRSVLAKFGTLTDRCGDFITAMVRASGAADGFTASAGATNKALRIHADAQGNYPPGTLFHLGAGGKGTTRHYTSTNDGVHLLEDETYPDYKGGPRVGHVSNKRTVDQIRPRILEAYLPTAAMASAWNKNHAAPAGADPNSNPNGNPNGELLPPADGPRPAWLDNLKAKKKVKAKALGSSATPVPPLFPSTAPSVSSLMGWTTQITKSDKAMLAASATAKTIKMSLAAVDDQEAHNLGTLGKHATETQRLNVELAANALRQAKLAEAQKDVNAQTTAQAKKTTEALTTWHTYSLSLDSQAEKIKALNEHRAKMKSGTPEYAAETAKVIKLNAAYAETLKRYHDSERFFTQQHGVLTQYGSELAFVKERLDAVAKSSARMNASLDAASGKAARVAQAKVQGEHETFFRDMAADKADGTSAQARTDAFNGEATQIAKDSKLLPDDKLDGQTAVQLRDSIAALKNNSPAAVDALADLDRVIVRLGQIKTAGNMEDARLAREKLQGITANPNLSKGAQADAIEASLSNMVQSLAPTDKDGKPVDATDPVAAEAALRVSNEAMANLYHEYYDKIGTLRKEDSKAQFAEYIRQTEAERQSLLNRAQHYGLDRDAFRNALNQKSDELEHRLLGDQTLEGMSQAAILSLVQDRLDAERTALAAADDAHKADLQTQLDQDTALANQLGKNFAARSKAEKTWGKDAEETQKVVKGVADRIGEDIGDMVTKSGHHMESLKTIMRDTFADILKTIIKKFVEEAILSLSQIAYDKIHPDPNSSTDATAPGKSKGGGILGTIGALGGIASSVKGGGNSSGGGGVSFGGGGGTGAVAGVASIAQTISSLFGGGLSAHAQAQASAPAAASAPSAPNGSDSTASGNAAGGLSVPAVGLNMGLAYARAQAQKPAVSDPGMSSGAQAVGTATGAIKDVAAAGGGLTRVFGSGLGGALGSALPVIGGVLALASLASSLFGQTKPDYVNKTGKTEFASVAGQDYTNSLDSGYSGDAGMRQVLRAHQDMMGRMNTAMTQAAAQPAVHFDAGAITVMGIHPGNTQEVAEALAPSISDKLSSNAQVHAAATGLGVN